MATVLLFVLSGAPALCAQESPAQSIIGRWEMEDAYTVHVDGPGDIRLESHQTGRFTIDLTVYSDGTGVLDATGFSWSTRGDAVLWQIGDRSVRLLPRPIDEDTVIIVALVEGIIGNGSAISVLHRKPE